MSLRQFAQCFFAGVPALQAFSGREDEMLKQFHEYKWSLPVMGAILLDEELKHCLLVKGAKASASWGFPKGKRDEGEADIDCAAREVFEETSFDASALLQEERSIEVSTKKGQRTKLYLVPGVDQATPFEPRCRGEISEYAWFPVEALPRTPRRGAASRALFEEGGGSKPLKFWKVQPFTRALRAWIRQAKQEAEEQEEEEQEEQEEEEQEEEQEGEEEEQEQEPPEQAPQNRRRGRGAESGVSLRECPEAWD